jgi:hypothetical protein
MTGVNGNVIMTGCEDDNPDDERREAARDNTKSISAQTAFEIAPVLRVDHVGMSGEQYLHGRKHRVPIFVALAGTLRRQLILAKLTSLL